MQKKLFIKKKKKKKKKKSRMFQESHLIGITCDYIYGLKFQLDFR